MRKRIGLGLLLLYLCRIASAADDSWHIEDFGTHDPAQLGDIAFNSYSADTKARIRSYLVANAPQTAEGLLARGWLSGNDGDAVSEVKLYRQCVEQYPQELHCLLNLADKSTVLSEREAALRSALENSPDFVDYAPVRKMYFLLLNDKKDPVAAEVFLQKYEAQNQGHAVFDYIRGLKALNNDKDNAKAAFYFRRAISKKQLHRTDVYQRLIELETGPLFEGGGDRLDVAMNIVHDYYAENDIKDRSLLFYLLQRFTKLQGTWGKRGSILLMAWATTGNAGAAKWEPELLDFLESTVWADSEGLADRAYQEVSAAPHSSFQKSWLGRIQILMRDDSDAGVKASWAGIEGAYTEKQRRQAMTRFMNDLQLVNRCDIADRYATQYLKRYKLDAGFYSQYFEVNLCTGDLSQAEKSLRMRRDLGEKDNAVLRDDEVRLALAKAELQPAVIPEAQRQPAQITDTNVLDLSPDGKLLAVGIDPIRLVDVQSQTLLAYLGQGTRYRFTQDGKHIVILGKNGLTVRDVASGRVTGHVVRRDSQHFRDFSMEPGSKRLAATDYRGFLYIYQLPDLKRLQTRKINETPLAAYVTWLKNGVIVTAAATERSVKRWRASDLVQQGELDGVNWVHTMDVSPSGQYLVAGDNESVLHVWDTTTWRHRLALASFMGHIAFNPVKDEAVINQWNGGSGEGIVDLKTLKVRNLPQEINEYFAYSPDGKILYRAHDGVEELDADTLEKRRTWPHASSDKTLAEYPELGVYAVAIGDRTKFFGLNDRKLIRTVEAGIGGLSVAGAKNLFSAGIGDRSYYYDYDKDQLVPTTPDTGSLSVNATVGARISRHPQLKGQLRIEFFNRGESTPFAEAAVAAATEDLQYARVPSDVGWGSETDPSGRYLILRTWWKDGFGHAAIKSKWINIYEMATGKWIKKIEVPAPVERISANGVDQQTMLLKTESAAYPLNFQSLVLETSKPVGTGVELRYEDDKIEVSQSPVAVYVLDKIAGTSRVILPPAGGKVAGAAYSPNAGLIILDGDGQTSIKKL